MQGYRPQFNVITDAEMAYLIQGFRPQFNIMTDIETETWPTRCRALGLSLTS
jgi:hypothetical protein